MIIRYKEPSHIHTVSYRCVAVVLLHSWIDKYYTQTRTCMQRTCMISKTQQRKSDFLQIQPAVIRFTEKVSSITTGGQEMSSAHFFFQVGKSLVCVWVENSQSGEMFGHEVTPVYDFRDIKINMKELDIIFFFA